MLRPIASNEIAWLVRLLVSFCCAFNDTLGLTAVPPPTPTDPPATILEVGGLQLTGCTARRPTPCGVSLLCTGAAAFAFLICMASNTMGSDCFELEHHTALSVQQVLWGRVVSFWVLPYSLVSGCGKFTFGSLSPQLALALRTYCVQELLRFVRSKGWRLNLRWLAEKPTLLWLFGLYWVWCWFLAIITSEGGLFSYPGYEEEAREVLNRQQTYIRP
jgi:hypothetical protein